MNNGIIKIPTYVKKKYLTKLSCSIEEFHNVHYQQMLNTYAYHRMLSCLICKHECKNLRSEYFWKTIML